MDILKPNDGGVEKVPGVPYLILVRNYLDAVVSDYQLFLREHEDSEETWNGFSQRKVAYYRAFVRKWVMEEDTIEKVIVRYEDLTDDSLTTFHRIMNFFAPQRDVDVQQLQLLIDNAALEDVRPDRVQVVRGFGVRNRRQIEAFQHFRPEVFQRLEELVAPQLQALGYASRYGGFEASRAA